MIPQARDSRRGSAADSGLKGRAVRDDGGDPLSDGLLVPGDLRRLGGDEGSVRFNDHIEGRERNGRATTGARQAGVDESEASGGPGPDERCEVRAGPERTESGRIGRRHLKDRKVRGRVGAERDGDLRIGQGADHNPPRLEAGPQDRRKHEGGEAAEGVQRGIVEAVDARQQAAGERHVGQDLRPRGQARTERQGLTARALNVDAQAGSELGQDSGDVGAWERRHAVVSTLSPSSAIILSRIRNFCTLPVTVIGNSSTKRT